MYRKRVRINEEEVNTRDLIFKEIVLDAQPGTIGQGFNVSNNIWNFTLTQPLKLEYYKIRQAILPLTFLTLIEAVTINFQITYFWTNAGVFDNKCWPTSYTITIPAGRYATVQDLINQFNQNLGFQGITTAGATVFSFSSAPGFDQGNNDYDEMVFTAQTFTLPAMGITPIFSLSTSAGSIVPPSLSITINGAMIISTLNQTETGFDFTTPTAEVEENISIASVSVVLFSNSTLALNQFRRMTNWQNFTDNSIERGQPTFVEFTFPSAFTSQPQWQLPLNIALQQDADPGLDTVYTFTIQWGNAFVYANIPADKYLLLRSSSLASAHDGVPFARFNGFQKNSSVSGTPPIGLNNWVDPTNSILQLPIANAANWSTVVYEDLHDNDLTSMKKCNVHSVEQIDLYWTDSATDLPLDLQGYPFSVTLAVLARNPFL